jgi:endogenous inhibitor of DNA gyrase (YacG/DUF329 family)
MPKPCPTCGKPAVWEENPDRPFCSERCRLVDLGRWSSEEYVVDSDPENDGGLSEGDSLPEDFQPS